MSLKLHSPAPDHTMATCRLRTTMQDIILLSHLCH